MEMVEVVMTGNSERTKARRPGSVREGERERCSQKKKKRPGKRERKRHG